LFAPIQALAFGITLASTVVFFLAGYATRRVRSALLRTVGLTAALVIPSTLSFGTLVHQDRLESALRLALTKQTVTFHNATLVSSAVDWTRMPPEAFAFARTKQRFHLIIFDERVVRVTAADGER
jgi:uncharacterized membrane protein